MNIDWKRVRSGFNWGLFYGIITWLLATGITNKYSNLAVWLIILSRTVMGVVIGLFQWEMKWWLRALIIGAVFNIPLAVLVALLGFGWNPWFWPILISGMVFGVLIELGIRFRLHQLEKMKEADSSKKS